jgi:hypothetical protein
MASKPPADACACCGAPFPPDAKRRGRLYCTGNRCRNKAYRERWAQSPVVGFQSDEAAAIAAAIAAGKVTRIENGAWPDTGREELRTVWKRRRKAA